ncbi:nucleotide sugar dehydrogenase [Cesiribacter andamanensis]|uniref:GDP-mannose 6-dehydrogenase n=1 Tax=Cesiribacter andamanensis AMV16 TaxID=1279009 RepID=M7NRR7_9BACT|nr:GDP-mannose 6-dehydrogenase [Cesiribacter andamanensis AMV16]
MLFDDLQQKKAKICVIGLGYVGLPIALEFAKQFAVIGFDINEKRVALMRQGIDPSKELSPEEFEGTDIHFTASLEEIRDAQFYVMAVPTPIDEHKIPDLKPLLSACTTVGKVLKKGDYVVFESTVYPGCTEEDCVPVLEKLSGLKFNQDFKVGYSPERINPGDKEHTLTKIVKVVSGSDAESAEQIAKVYSAIITAGVHQASSIKVAEAAKIIENTQRDVNIALMNELSIIFNKMSINTFEVLEAAGTKWNFLPFKPGLVGGHCIGVDPYYLTHKSSELGYHSKVILSGRTINDGMGALIAKSVVQHIIGMDKSLKQSRVLVLGATFKENVSDIRNSKVADVVQELKSFMVNIDVADPHADSEELEHEYGFGLVEAPTGTYDAIILAVNHREYERQDSAFFKKLLNKGGLLYDVKGIMRRRADGLAYQSL